MRAGLLGLLVFAVAAQPAPPPRDIVNGRVVNALTNEPLRGAIVLAAGVEKAGYLTDVNGRFRLSAADGPLTLLATKTGYLDVRLQIAPGDRSAPFDVPLTPSASLTGRVLGPTGEPVPGAAVRAAMEGEVLEARAHTTTTDDRGDYVLDRLAAGKYIVTAGRTAGASMRRPHPLPVTATVEPGEERDRVDLQVPADQGEEAALPLDMMKPAAGTRTPLRAGSGSITGSVRTRYGRGVANIIVTASPAAESLGIGTPTLSAVSDADGVFVIDGLPAGDFSVIAHRRTTTPTMGTVPVSDPTRPIHLTAGQRQAGVDITIREAGAIAGTIRDEFGDPISARVSLLVASGAGGLLTHATRITDDRGRYRFLNLRPNRYLVMASIATTTSPVRAGDGSDTGRLVGSAAYFYPGVAAFELATPVETSPGSEATLIDVTVAYEPVADVALSIPAPSDTVERIDARRFPLHGRVVPAVSTSRDQVGVTFEGVTAGPWLFTVAATVTTPNGPETQWARHEITTDGRTRSGASLTLQPGARLTGRIIQEGISQPLRSPNPAIVISLAHVGGPITSEPLHRFNAETSVRGGFTIRGVMPGTYVIQAAEQRVGSAWTLSKATVGGRDVLDLPIELGAGADLRDVVLTLTPGSTELSGMVSDVGGQPLAETEFVVVTADPKYQYPGSRRSRRVVTASDGSYTVRGLPPGEYRIGRPPPALSGAELIRFPRPTLPIALSLADGERKTQNLTLVR